MVSLVIGLAISALRLANLALLVYCVMSFVMPHHPLYRKAYYYMERVLGPIRRTLYNLFPSMRNLAVDFTPLVLWLLMDIGMSVLSRLLRVL